MTYLSIPDCIHFSPDKSPVLKCVSSQDTCHAAAVPRPQSPQPAGTRIKLLVLQLAQLALRLICSVLLAHSLRVLCSTVD